MDKMTYFVYLIECRDGTYYTGHSDDPHRRLNQHITGTGAKYTKKHKVQNFRILSGHSTRSEAMKEERRIKKLSHGQKKKLINQQP